jgi:chemotaxis protein MotA
MMIIVGYIVVLGSVIGGFMVSGGHLGALIQPGEYIIILGAAIGSFFASQTKYSFGLILRSMKHVFGDPGMSKARYLETLALLYTLFIKMQREGVISIEGDIERPESSGIFGKYPALAKNHLLVHFVADTLRVYLTTGSADDIDSLMKEDLDSMHEEELLPAEAIGHMAESMPGLGIVAAVLGVVLTMGQINEPPEVLGHHIAAALIGTFIGILFCYGFFGPMGSKLETAAMETHLYYNSVKEAVAAAIRGATPIIAVEYGRRAIPHAFRPTFLEMEEQLKSR